MATYVNLDGVRTWYDETGTGEPLVLLQELKDENRWPRRLSPPPRQPPDH
jgi:hypothetical protein